VAGGEKDARMAKTISCRDVSVDCDFQATGETVEDVMQKCAHHAKSADGLDEIPPELAVKVQSAIREV
jgi:predicted small metal-binding protein